MSTSILTSVASQPVPSGRAHRRMVTLGAIVAILGTAAILVYGTGYYLSSPMDRPYHPRHAMLRPSGPIGLGLGVFGFFLFVLIFLYPLRKRWLWLSKIGNSRHWFDWHILMGLTAPVVIAFHASFKFRGIAGMAYWIMFAVSASGIVGRYLFAQIPRSRSSAELSLQESKHLQETLTAELGAQKVLRPADLAQLFRLPSEGYVASKSGLRALFSIFWIDMQRPFRVARLRRSVLGPMDKLLTLGGLFASRNRKLERIVAVAREQARLSKKLLFLAKSHQIFHLWHVVHRPFSYSFAILALMHVTIAVLFGFFR